MIPRFIAGFASVVSALLFVYYVGDEIEKIFYLKHEEEALIQEIADAERASDRIQELVSDFESFPPDVDARLRVMIPDRTTPTKLLADLDALVRENGLTIENANAERLGGPVDSSGKQTDPLSSYEVRFETKGTYQALRELLASIERSLAIHDIAGIEFKAMGDDSVVVYSSSGDPLYSFVVRLRTYSMTEL